jgi:hypothetical protein
LRGAAVRARRRRSGERDRAVGRSGQNTTLQSFGPGGNRSWNQTASSASILLVGFPALNAAEYTARNASIFIARAGRLQRLR